MKNTIIILFFLICSIQMYGTTEYLAKNDLTKELFIFEDGGIIEYDGLFWYAVSGEEKEIKKQENMLLLDGYKYTKNPYKIEIGIIAIIIFIIGIGLGILKRKKNLT